MSGAIGPEEGKGPEVLKEWPSLPQKDRHGKHVWYRVRLIRHKPEQEPVLDVREFIGINDQTGKFTRRGLMLTLVGVHRLIMGLNEVWRDWNGMDIGQGDGAQRTLDPPQA